MQLVLPVTPQTHAQRRFSPALLSLMLLLSAALLLACNPFGGNDEEAAAQDSQDPSMELVDVNLSATGQGANSDGQQAPGETAATQVPPTATPEPVPTEDPSNTVNAPATAAGTADEARNLVWAFLSQCVPLSISDLEATEIQGEWFVQAAGESSDKYGLWKADPVSGTVEPHNIRARQWEPLVDQNCTPEVFSGFFTPTPSPLLNANITEAEQAVTTLWATLVNCYPNMKTTDLEATLNQSQGEWVVTTKPGVNAKYGVWAVGSDGTVLPKNRQAQGVFDQLNGGLC